MLVGSIMAATLVSSALMGQFSSAKIGDVDGFGWGYPWTSGTPQNFVITMTGPPPYYQPYYIRSSNTYLDPRSYDCGLTVSSDYRPFNPDGSGLLGTGDFLPDLDQMCSHFYRPELGIDYYRRMVAYQQGTSITITGDCDEECVGCSALYATTSTTTGLPAKLKSPTDFVSEFPTGWNLGMLGTDDWDWREAHEAELLLSGKEDSLSRSCTGCTFGDTSSGAVFTDMTLSTTFNNSFSGVAPANKYLFPTNPRTSENEPRDSDNQPRFVFDLVFNKTGITTSTKFYFNVLLADFEGLPSTELKFTTYIHDGSGLVARSVYKCLTAQDANFEDALIQGASIELNQLFTVGGEDGFAWTDVLREHSATEYTLYFQVDWVHRDECGVDKGAPDPLTAFDFAEIALNSDSIKTRYVGAGQPYSTIQSAIDSIPAGQVGWTIIVTPGTYAKFNVGGKLVSIVSRTLCDSIGTGATIDAAGTGSAVTYAGTETSGQLSGFTIINGAASVGAGINGNGANIQIHNCTIESNTASTYGGGIAGIDGPIDACLIQNNSAGYDGGGIYDCNGPIVDSTISTNTAADDGGGIHLSSGRVERCTISGNTAADEGGGLHSFTGEVIACTITGNTAHDGAGMYNTYLRPVTVLDSTFQSNVANSDGGGIYNFFVKVVVERTKFLENAATYGDGGGVFDGFQVSGLILPSDYINCVFWKNTALNGGGLMAYDTIPTVTNCTFHDNSATTHGGGIANLSGGWAAITNCILYKNKTAGVAQSEEVYAASYTTSPAPTYSVISNYPGPAGTGLFPWAWVNPDFVDAAAGDLHIQSSSACKNTGTNTDAPTLDLDKYTRPLTTGNKCDMGAYEYH